METFDLGVIGGGPAGYTAALYAAKEGKSVVIFEKDELGGTCLNKGCIPTKLFLHAADVYNYIKNCDSIGLSCENVSFDFAKILEHKDKTVLKLRKSLELLIKNSKITVIKSEASIGDKNTIMADGIEYKCSQIVVCSGSKPREIKGLEFDHKFILNSDDILNLSELPKKIVIVGSGAIGIEWTRILSSFDVEVTIIDLAKTLCPLADWEVSKRIERMFKMKKIKYYLETVISKIDGNKITLSNGVEIEADCILSAVGREKIVPDNLSEGVSIIGDASAEIMLAHYAIHQAKNLILGIDFNKKLVPSVIYGTPEIAWIGECMKTPEEETEKGYKKVVFPISALGKAHCDGNIDGFIKILAGGVDGKQIMGAHIISKEASALIQQIVIAMQNNLTVDDLKKVCYAHPTYSEGIFESVMQL